MKANIIIVVMAISTLVNAQEKELKFGVKAFPIIAWSRVSPEEYKESPTINYVFESNGAKAGAGFGIFTDYYFNENIAFSLGINYIFSSSKFLINKNGSTEIVRNYDTQYLQLPISIKLITNEITDRVKLYISPGMGLNLLTAASVDGKSSYQKTVGEPVTRYTSELGLIDINFIIATGVEYELDNNMKLILGISYMHGFLNMNKIDTPYISNSEFSLKNNVLGLEVGLKF